MVIDLYQQFDYIVLRDCMSRHEKNFFILWDNFSKINDFLTIVVLS